MSKALITGIAGFAGSHLAELLLAEGMEVCGLDRNGMSLSNIRGFKKHLQLRELDILDSRAVEKAVEDLRPDLIFHLAAVAYVPHAQYYPSFVFDVNAKGTLHLLQACKTQAPGARLVLVSSSQVYGQLPPERLPLTERTKPRPNNVYALSKLCSEEIALLYRREYDLDVVILRPFNHIGPRQRPVFVVADLARQIARIEAGKQEAVLKVGNLSSARDFTDVRDMVRGYYLAAERGVSGEIYNLSSGRARMIRSIMKKLLALTDREIEVQPEKKRFRGKDISILYGKSDKFRKATGWSPRHRLQESLESVLNYWRKNYPPSR